MKTEASVPDGLDELPVGDPEGTGENPGEQTGVEAATPPALSVGQRLRAAREAKGLTTADVAGKLKLSTHQVEALESDDSTRLPWNTIIRGFVRNYARLINIDPAELMAVLDRESKPQNANLEISVGTRVRVPHENAVEGRDYVRVVTGFVILVVAVLAYFFFPVELWHSAVARLTFLSKPAEVAVVPAKSETPEGRSETTVAAPAAIILATEPAAAQQQNPSVPVVPVVVTASSATPVAVNARETTPATSQKISGSVLKLSFAQPSWVEVRDRSGEIIFSQLSQGGSQREIEGRPPFSLVVGNATHVTLQYKGKPVDLSKRSKDDVARVTVE